MEAIFSLERNLLEWSNVVKSHGSVKKRTCRRQCRRAFGSSPEDDGLVGGVCFVRGAVRLRMSVVRGGGVVANHWKANFCSEYKIWWHPSWLYTVLNEVPN